MLSRARVVVPKLCRLTTVRALSLQKQNPLPSFSEHAKQVLFPATYQNFSTAEEFGQAYEDEGTAANHLGRQQNHIWSKEEITQLLADQPHHQPKSVSDHIMRRVMNVLYHSFNFLTGYKHENPSVKSIEWRLIVLESVAGVPGFVGAGFRHFRSLRLLQRDHGWISTLLEEAENERMHLLICLRMFKSTFLTRTVVIGAQFVIAPILTLLYLVHPPAVHRFVGYLEETACATYTNIVQNIEKEGTDLNKAWSPVPAPPIAKSYYRLPSDATFCDTLKCMFADECHHRDVNHTFASMKPEEPNPFALQHKQDALRAFTMEITGETAWPETAEKARATPIARISQAVYEPEQKK
mmetsp:Transcript_98349/g.278134  ORF Transcript_98349/g.278134 Transcript_98349/m.278134 type:complete len:353 (-) Transcript_98349:104-1162(-)